MGDEIVIEGYRFYEEIGKGGMGCVYKGKAPNGESIAIKMLDNQFCFDPEIREMFYNEVESLKRLYHPSVVGVRGHAFQDSCGNLYMPMEFVDGETIQQRVKRDGPFSEQAARDMMSKILKSFSYIHGQKKVHRDIKPSNIMIRPNGEICVIDFGIVKDMATSTGKTIGMIVGTDGYMSPEQVTGLSIDYRTDIYSLGCLLHFMLTGTHAVVKKSNEVETRMSILNDAFPCAKTVRPELSDDIQAVIYKAVDKNMLKRFQTVDEFEKAINGQTSDHRTTFDGTKVTIGKKEDCDIVIQNQYVSRHHLIIRYKKMQDGPIVEIEDASTNGTGVDGKYLHNGSVSFPFNLSNVIVTFGYGGQEVDVLYMGESVRLPKVYLAGRPEISLDWDEVMVKMHEKIPNEFSNGGVAPEDKLSLGWCILSFLIPPIGFVMSSSLKNTKPKTAKSAAKFGWIGFFIWLVSLIIIILYK